MAAAFQEWHLQLKNSRTRRPIDDNSGAVAVLNASLPTAPVIYSDDRGTVASNPIALAGGLVHFYTAITIQLLDLSILSGDGQARFMQNVTPSDQHIDIDPEDRNQLLVVPFNSASPAVEVDSGLTLPASAQLDPFGPQIKVVTQEAGKTIDVGLKDQNSDVSNAIILGQSLATAGYPDSNTKIGGLLSSTNAIAGGVLFYVPGERLNVTYTVSAAATVANGYILIPYRNLP